MRAWHSRVCTSITSNWTRQGGIWTSSTANLPPALGRGAVLNGTEWAQHWVGMAQPRPPWMTSLVSGRRKRREWRMSACSTEHRNRSRTRAESAARLSVNLHWGGEAKPVPRALQGCHLPREGGCSAERHKAGSTLSTDGLASSPSQSDSVTNRNE